MKVLKKLILTCSLSALLCTNGSSSDLDQENETLAAHPTTVDHEFSLLNELPPEIQLRVFSFVKPQDILSLNSTARSLNEITQDNELWFDCLKAANIISFDEKYNAEENYYSYHILDKRPLIRLLNDEAYDVTKTTSNVIYFNGKGTYITTNTNCDESFKVIVKKKNIFLDSTESYELTPSKNNDSILIMQTRSNMETFIGHGFSSESLTSRYPIIWTKATDNYIAQTVEDLVKRHSQDAYNITYKTVDAISPNGRFITGTALIEEVTKLFILDMEDQSMRLLEVDLPQGYESVNFCPFYLFYSESSPFYNLNDAKAYVDNQGNVSGKSLFQVNYEIADNQHIANTDYYYFGMVRNNVSPTKIEIKSPREIRQVRTIPGFTHLSPRTLTQKESELNNLLKNNNILASISSINLNTNSSCVYGSVTIDGSKITPYIANLPNQVNKS